MLGLLSAGTLWFAWRSRADAQATQSRFTAAQQRLQTLTEETTPLTKRVADSKRASTSSVGANEELNSKIAAAEESLRIARTTVEKLQTDLAASDEIARAEKARDAADNFARGSGSPIATENPNDDAEEPISAAGETLEDLAGSWKARGRDAVIDLKIDADGTCVWMVGRPAGGRTVDGVMGVSKVEMQGGKCTAVDHIGSVNYVVTSVFDMFDHSDDSVALSLREAVDLANTTSGAQTIWLSAWLLLLTRAGSDSSSPNVSIGDLDILEDLTILGIDDSETTIDATVIVDDVFHEIGTANLTIDRLTAING